MSEQSLGKKAIWGMALFYVIAIALRYLTNKVGLASGISISFLKVIVQALGPALGALVAVKVFRLDFVMTVKGVFRTIWTPLLVFWLLPVVLIAGNAYLRDRTFPWLAVCSILVYGLLEEIGWRGFLQEQLKSLPRFRGIAIITVLWFVWHLNFKISSGNLVFLLILLLGSWGLNLVAHRTRSLLAVAAFHSLNNFYPEWDQTTAMMAGIMACVWIGVLIYMKKTMPVSEQS